MRCYVCKKIGHLARNCMNRDTTNNGEENQSKLKIIEIRTQRNQKWVRKSKVSIRQDNEAIIIQSNELGEASTSTM